MFRLCELAARYDERFRALRESVRQLDDYDVEARYPNVLEDVILAEFYSERDAEVAIAMAQAVHAHVGARLGVE
ncbi:MAG: HEPN domain-containing protein [Thermoflexales bacterium]|nr:HEPN domain-containing protein [Thermoflexales bacterium]